MFIFSTMIEYHLWITRKVSKYGYDLRVKGHGGERSGSVVECLTRDRGVEGLSLIGFTASCPWARHINPTLVLVQVSTQEGPSLYSWNIVDGTSRIKSNKTNKQRLWSNILKVCIIARNTSSSFNFFLWRMFIFSTIIAYDVYITTKVSIQNMILSKRSRSQILKTFL